MDAIAQGNPPSRFAPGSIATTARKRHRRNVVATTFITMCVVVGGAVLMVGNRDQRQGVIAAPAQSTASTAPAAISDPQTLYGRWLLTSLNGSPVAEAKDMNGLPIGLTVRTATHGAGLLLSTNSWCNSAGVEVELGVRGELSKGDVLNTLVACEDPYGGNLGVLAAADQLTLSGDRNALSLLRSGMVVAQYERQD
jgi:hypothetical protein